MTCFKIVPWSSFCEWKDVYQMILQNEYSHALEILELWDSRSIKMPVAVESTLFYLAIQRDCEKENEITQRLMIASFLIKFINGLVDREQVQFYAQSVTELANKLEIPRWISDLRHDCTHDKLPSLPVLKETSEMAFEWLWNNYWKPQHAYLESMPIKMENELDSYKKYLKIYFKQNLNSLQLEENISKRIQCLFGQLPLVVAENSFRSEMLKMIFLKAGFFLSRKSPLKSAISAGTCQPIFRWRIWLPLVEELAKLSTSSSSTIANQWQIAFEEIVQILLEFLSSNRSNNNNLDDFTTHFIQMLSQMLNSSESFTKADINFSFLLLHLKQLSNSSLKQSITLFLQSLEKKDEKLLGIMHKFSSSNNPNTSTSLQEKQHKLQMLRQKLSKNSSIEESCQNTCNDWNICSDWDFNVPLGYPPTYTHTNCISLFHYLQQQQQDEKQSK